MARTINEIKESMLNAYAEDDIIREKYGMVGEDKPEFPKVSIENILFYVIAAMLWTVEVLFDRHKKEVTDYIDQMKPHGLRWYVSKAKMFRLGKSLASSTDKLIDGTDRYPDRDEQGKILSDKEIEELQIVKFAAATESEGVIFLKVATTAGQGAEENAETEGGEEENKSSIQSPDKSKLNNVQLVAFTEYINEVKDAGVKVKIISAHPDTLKINLDIYVNPMVITTEGKSISHGGEPVVEAIKNYISNLPFNGEYRNVDLVDALQAVDGVVIPELKAVWTSDGNVTDVPVDAKSTPYSGYYVLDESNSDIKYFVYN